MAVIVYIMPTFIACCSAGGQRELTRVPVYLKNCLSMGSPFVQK